MLLTLNTQSSDHDHVHPHDNRPISCGHRLVYLCLPAVALEWVALPYLPTTTILNLHHHDFDDQYSFLFLKQTLARMVNSGNDDDSDMKKCGKVLIPAPLVIRL